MRKLGIQQIEDIALGASLLGAGGGGDPYIGKLMAIGAVRECGEVTLISPEEVPDDALIMPIAMMGAPTVLCEKGIGGTEYKRIFEMVERYFGRKVYATMPMEAGGVNSMLPIAAAARLGADAAVLMHAGVTLAFFGAEAASLLACLQHTLDDWLV